MSSVIHEAEAQIKCRHHLGDVATGQHSVMRLITMKWQTVLKIVNTGLVEYLILGGSWFQSQTVHEKNYTCTADADVS